MTRRSRRFRKLTPEQSERLHDERLGLSMIPRNVARRRSYRNTHQRVCKECGVKVGPYLQYCWHCVVRKSAPQLRMCAGVDGTPCAEDLTGTRRKRCDICADYQRRKLIRERVRKFRHG